MNREKIIPLDIKDLLSKGQYIIPIYQRNYDWGERESLQLIQDIADYAKCNSEKKYYIGSLVVFLRSKQGSVFFETIDGQQRLTTLTILMNVLLRRSEVKDLMQWFTPSHLSYDHREDSDEALRLLFEGEFSTRPSAASIVEVYKVLNNNLDNTLTDRGLSLRDFTEYLLSKVIIMRIPVPQDTELNHYFEIMNSRGEQLEKHEVLKAILMSKLDKKKHILFNVIWEACSDLSSYVQMNFRPNLRSVIFTSTWTELQFEDFESLYDEFINLNEDDDSRYDENEKAPRTITQLFIEAKSGTNRYRLPDDEDDNDSENDRFGSIINFPNFLLHALKVAYHYDECFDEEIDKGIKLDDKRLVDIFSMVVKSVKDSSAFVKRYIMALLTCRFLFDKYVIKRESYNGKEGWSLKMLKQYEHSKVNYVGTFSGSEDEDTNCINKDILMLEAMFHVSAPTQIYKNWMNAVLNYVYRSYFHDGAISDSAFRKYLYTLSCTYMLDRYLCVKEERIDFEDIIYTHDGTAQHHDIHWMMIDKGCEVENFVFNFYDYITWKKGGYPQFEFSYRTSVEHFYPRTPMPEYPVLDKKHGIDHFGNLCLISRGMNSKFSNNMPKAKYENFGNEAIAQTLSIKLNEMMKYVANGEWGEKQIFAFEEAARKRILTAITKGSDAELKEYSE